MQDDLENFEKEVAEYSGCKFAVEVMLLTHLKCSLVLLANRDDEVIISSHTMIATASAIYVNGAKPIPVE